MAFTKYPITDYNNLNIDWLIQTARDAVDAGATAEESARLAAESAEAAAASAAEAEASLSSRYVTMIGDSYLALSDSTITETVAAGLGRIGRQNAAGSIGFVHVSGGAVIEDLLNFGEESERQATDYLIIYGGINDGSEDPAAVKTAVESCLSTARSLYPKARILVIGPQASTTGVRGEVSDKIHQAMLAACLSSGVSYSDARRWLVSGPFPYSDLYKSDNVHPTTLGYKLIASKILNVINGHDDSMPAPVFTKAETADTISAGYTIVPGGIVYYGKGSSRTFTSGIYNNIIKISAPSLGLFGAANSSSLGYVCKASNGNPRAILAATQIYVDSDDLVFIRCIPSETYTGDFMFFGFLPTTAVVLSSLPA